MKYVFAVESLSKTASTRADGYFCCKPKVSLVRLHLKQKYKYLWSKEDKIGKRKISSPYKQTIQAEIKYGN